MSLSKCFKVVTLTNLNQLRKLFAATKINLDKNNIPSNVITSRNFCSKDSESCEKNEYYKHNYDEKIESAVNQQINCELNAWYAYMNIATYYGRSSVALPGCHGYFMKMCYEEHEHAMTFIRYQNLRGGNIELSPIEPLAHTEWECIPEAFTCALDMEKSVKEKLTSLYKLAEECKDSNVQDMLDPFIYDQERSICELSRLLTRANYLTKDCVGKYLFDRELHETHVKIHPAPCKPEKEDKAYV